MSNIYEISGQFAQLFAEYDDMIAEMAAEGIEESEAEQAWFDTLSAMEGEFELKAESTALYIMELCARADAIKAAENKLAARRRAYVNKADRMKDFLMGCMDRVNLKKVETARTRILVRNNAPSLKIEDETAFIEMLQENGRDDLLKYSQPEIRKNDIKKLIKDGEDFVGASLVASKSVVIS